MLAAGCSTTEVAPSASPAASVRVSLAPTPTAPPGTTAPAATTPVPTPAAAADWPTYHADGARTGAASGVASFTAIDPAWQTAALEGDVYAEPIVVGGRAIVATERNIVYSFDARSGAQQWRVALGPPVDASTLPCGNIRPVTGITGTPVADAGAGLLYLVAFEQPAHHELYAIELASGTVRYHRTIDPPGADPHVHQQRSALTLANDTVYVAYGGLAGDCGSYHGWVVGARTSGPTSALLVYQVPTNREGGIWTPSGMAVDANGRIYAVTGNSDSQGTYDYNDAVLRLSPDLKLEDYWAPRDWLALSRSDTDIGSTGPTLLRNGLVIEAGKNGIAYLLRADQLGGIGGELAQLRICPAVFGGFAYAAGVVYVPCTDGVAALQVGDDRSMRVLWRGPRGATGPPIIAAGAVWVMDPNAGILYALDVASGQARMQRQVGTSTRFTTPTAFGDEILIAAGGRLTAVRVR